MKEWILRTTAYPTRGLKVRHLVLAGLIGVSLGLLVRVAGHEIPFWQLVLTMMAVPLLHRVVTNQRDPVVEHESVANRRVNQEQSNVFATATDWERILAYSEKYPDLFSETTAQEKLRKIVSDRLRVKHHVVMDQNPEAAQEIIGTSLYQFLHYPVATAPSRGQFDKYLSQIERI